MTRLQIFLSIPFFVFSVSLFAQETTISIDDDSGFEVQYPIKNTLKPVDAKKVTKLILSKTQLDKETIPELKKLVHLHAKESNVYLKSKTFTREQQMELKELETKYKFELRSLLGEENYRKLLVVVPLDS